MATYVGKIPARSPFYFVSSGTTLESAQLEVRIWSDDITTDRPASPQYTIAKTPLTSTADEITFEISDLIRDYFVHNRDAYADVDTTFADALWVQLTETVVDSTGSTVTEYIYSAVDGYGYFEDGVNPVVQSDDFTLVVLQDEDIRVPVQITGNVIHGENNYIKFYDLDGTLRFDSGTIAEGLNSQGKVSYITQSQGTWNMSRADVGHTAGSINYTITFQQAEQCQQDATEVKFYDKDGALFIIYMLGRQKTGMSVRSDEYRKDLGTLALSAYSYSIEEHQQQTYNVTGNETFTLNSGFMPDGMNRLFKQLLLSEFIWVDDNPVNIVSSNIEFQENVTDKLINYQLNFKRSHNVINNI